VVPERDQRLQRGRLGERPIDAADPQPDHGPGARGQSLPDLVADLVRIKVRGLVDRDEETPSKASFISLSPTPIDPSLTGLNPGSGLLVRVP